MEYYESKMKYDEGAAPEGTSWTRPVATTNCTPLAQGLGVAPEGAN